MANISQEQFGQLMQNAPQGTDPKQMMDALIQRGHTLEGYTPPAPPQPSFGSKIVSGARGVWNALTSSEQAFGQDIAGAATTVLPGSWTGQDSLDQAQKYKQDAVTSTLQHIQEYKQQGKDPSKLLNVMSQLTGQQIPTMADLYPAMKKSGLQVAGDAAGVLLDILSSGTYGNAAKGAETGKLLVKGGGVVDNLATKAGIATSEKIATPVVENAAKQTVGQTLKTIGTKTAVRSAVGAGTGYGYDVSQNLQEGKTGAEALKPGYGTLLGGAVPAAIGGIQAGVALTKETAPRFINSLIKPRQADFSYGKDPGRTVSAMGITGNNMEDFSHNLRTAKQDIGNQIGEIYKNPANANITINASDEVAKIDKAMADAAKGGKGNQVVVTALQNTKDALLYEHGIDAEGNITKMGDTPRNLSKLTPQEAFDLKKLVADNTKFTGNPSDDKTVNSVLKNIYGGIKEKLNNSVGVNNPEIKDLNQKYADLTSAEIATTHRDQIVKRADQISMPIKVGGATALITAVASGGAAIPALLAGAGAAALDKALSSTAVKTRIAAWLGSESPGVINKVLQQNPAIKTVLYRALPKFASQLGTNNDSLMQQIQNDAKSSSSFNEFQQKYPTANPQKLRAVFDKAR